MELLADPNPPSSQHALRAPLPLEKRHFNTRLTMLDPLFFPHPALLSKQLGIGQQISYVCVMQKLLSLLVLGMDLFSGLDIA